MTLKISTTWKRCLLLVSGLILLAGGGLVTRNVVRASQQQRVVRWLNEHQGFVYYSHEIGAQNTSNLIPRKWLRKRLGIDYCENVVTVTLCPTTSVKDLSPLAELPHLIQVELAYTSASDLKPLASLKHLRNVALREPRITDLSPLLTVPNLETLILESTPVNDVKLLMNLKSLKYLQLNKTEISEADYQALQKALPECIIYWSPLAGSPTDPDDEYYFR
ncbi:MAG: hypothetical protein KDA70_18100 [Planctomycetaceae bacterium]|nr:hypothetical protein [Planctomycetaceae bacterium]